MSRQVQPGRNAVGVVLEGEVEIETDTGARRILRAGEVFDIPPGHNARVIGDEP
jgi:quercetin dioxygenase-like cupin family protein